MLKSDKFIDLTTKPSEQTAKIATIADQLDAIIAELDALRLTIPANHLSLGRDLLREAIPDSSRLQ